MGRYMTLATGLLQYDKGKGWQGQNDTHSNSIDGTDNMTLTMPVTNISYKLRQIFFYKLECYTGVGEGRF